MVRKRDLVKYIRAPQIIPCRGLQVFEFHGQDARGFDFTVQLSPLAALAGLEEAPVSPADRVKMYLGGDPADIGRLGSEIELQLGEASFRVDAAAMAYIPRGISFRHQVLRPPAQNAWAFSLTLPPEYREPGRTAEKKPAPPQANARPYEKYLLRQVTQKWPTINPLASDFVAGSRDFMQHIEGARPNFALYYIMRAGMFPETPHSHHCDEYLMFLPTDPHDMQSLGAVVEVAYGEEWKKVSFSQAALVFFPKELQHCPIHVKKMDRPFLFGHFWPMGEESHILPAK